MIYKNTFANSEKLERTINRDVVDRTDRTNKILK